MLSLASSLSSANSPYPPPLFDPFLDCDSPSAVHMLQLPPLVNLRNHIPSSLVPPLVASLSSADSLHSPPPSKLLLECDNPSVVLSLASVVHMLLIPLSLLRNNLPSSSMPSLGGSSSSANGFHPSPLSNLLLDHNSYLDVPPLEESVHMLLPPPIEPLRNHLPSSSMPPPPTSSTSINNPCPPPPSNPLLDFNSPLAVLPLAVAHAPLLLPLVP